MLTKLQNVEVVDVALYSTPATDDGSAGNDDVDQRLLELAKRLNARVLTNDFNLDKVAQFRGVPVVNLNAVAAAVKTVVRIGERVRVTIQKPGDLPGQGIGYLPDGTMVVVEQARGRIDQDVDVAVTNTRQNAAGANGVRADRHRRRRAAAAGRPPAGRRPPAAAGRRRPGPPLRRV